MIDYHTRENVSDEQFLARFSILAFLPTQVNEASNLFGRAMAFKPSASLRLKRSMMLPPVFNSSQELRERRMNFLSELEQLRSMPADALRVPRDALYDLGVVPSALAYTGLNNKGIMNLLREVSEEGVFAVAVVVVVIVVNIYIEDDT